MGDKHVKEPDRKRRPEVEVDAPVVVNAAGLTQDEIKRALQDASSSDSGSDEEAKAVPPSVQIKKEKSKEVKPEKEKEAAPAFTARPQFKKPITSKQQEKDNARDRKRKQENVTTVKPKKNKQLLSFGDEEEE